MKSNTLNSMLVGSHPAFLNVLNTTAVISATDVTVHLAGESGTGKELFAQSIHRSSKRATQAFVSINCASIPEALAESELFGHTRGAFTGADKAFSGRILQADGGTLFLDEIGELSMGVQSKLLRFLENKEVQALGSTQTQAVDVRIITATNRNLMDMVNKGEFREDLYYRLSVVPVELPPLRKRKSDIPLLLEHLSQISAQQHQLEMPNYSSEARKAILAYSWPGNVRELRNFSERMLILFSGKNVGLENLPSELRQSQASNLSQQIQNIFKLPESGISLDALEKSLFTQALDIANGNQTRASRLLGISRDTFLYRLKKYGI